MNKECATITLHSNYVSSLGSSELVFRNIPIKKILGDMYDKYNKFKLVLNTHAGNYLAGATNREYQFRITGLDFINTIDYKLLTKLQKPAIFVPFVKTTATQNLNQFTANHGAVFTKPANQMVDITLSYTDRYGYLVSGNIGVNMFVFSIYGVEE